MEAKSPECQRIRQEIAQFEFDHIPDAGFPSMAGYSFSQLPSDWWSKVEAYKRADSILSIKGLAILSDDQSVDQFYGVVADVIPDMLKAKFKRVI